MTNSFLDVTFPPGRLVQGSLYELNDKDWQGKPLTIKMGPNAGQLTKRSFIAVAIPKTAGVGHWASEAWGAPIWAAGHAWFPNGEAQATTFAWKIEDGDSAIPNKKGRKNCETEGMPGHWIVNISSSFLPKVVTAHGDPLEMPGAVKNGYWVRAMARITSNGQTGGNAGIYVNPSGVAYLGIDKEISTGPNLRALLAAAQQHALPAHVQAAPTTVAGGPPPMPNLPPPGQHLPPPPPAGVTVGAPMAPIPGSAPVLPPPPAPPAATTVAPSPTFLAPPPPPAATVAPVAAPLGPVMTPKANGLTYAQFIAQGWNDAALRREGYMA